VSKRAFDPSSPIEELDQDIASYVNQNPLLLKRAEKALAAFKDNFPLERVVKVLIFVFVLFSLVVHTFLMPFSGRQIEKTTLARSLQCVSPA